MEHRRWLLAIVVGLFLCSLQLQAQENQTIFLQASEGTKAKHGAEKDDIDNIGSRNIGGKGLGNWYSLEQEIVLGRRYSQAIEASTQLMRDQVITEYVNRIAQNLVRNSDAQLPFTIKVIDSDEINAFALPGGLLYVNTGLIEAAQEEAELAGVMAHEIAHVTAHHAARQMTRSHLFTLASIPLIFVGGGVGVALQQAAGLTESFSIAKFSRGFESEADYLGVEYLYKAGYDPLAFISFFERIQTLEKQKPGRISKAFSSHPQTADRIHKTQSEIAKILPPREAYVITTSEFDDVKFRLEAIENRRQPREQDSSRPTLRRAPNADQDDETADDERPTLKRRSDQ